MDRTRLAFCNVYYSGFEDKHEFGSEFLVNKRLYHLVSGLYSCKTIATIRIRSKFYNISIVCAHAPTERKDFVVKDALEGSNRRIPVID